VAHRGEAEFCIGHAFERDVIRVLVDALQWLAATGAVAQFRGVVVGAGRPGVELVGRALAQRLELRLQCLVHRVTQVQPQQAGQIRVDGKEVDAPAVGNVQMAAGMPSELASDWLVDDIVHARVSRLSPWSGQHRNAFDNRPIQVLSCTIRNVYRSARPPWT
jgi:hypothetical protein